MIFDTVGDMCAVLTVLRLKLNEICGGDIQLVSYSVKVGIILMKHFASVAHNKSDQG